MKAWEETWRVFEANKGFPAFAAEVAPHFVSVFESLSGDDDDVPRAKLAAAAPEMARLLVELQSVDCGDDGPACPACGKAITGVPHGTSMTWRQDHQPDCRLVAVLRKAGVVDR